MWNQTLQSYEKKVEKTCTSKGEVYANFTDDEIMRPVNCRWAYKYVRNREISKPDF